MLHKQPRIMAYNYLSPMNHDLQIRRHVNLSLRCPHVEGTKSDILSTNVMWVDLSKSNIMDLELLDW